MLRQGSFRRGRLLLSWSVASRASLASLQREAGPSLEIRPWVRSPIQGAHQLGGTKSVTVLGNRGPHCHLGLPFPGLNQYLPSAVAARG